MPGLLRGMARVAVVSGTATAVSGRVARRQNNRWAQQEAQEEYPPQQQYAPPPAQAPADDEPDMIEQLTKLAALKDQGILTEEEFAAQKARILAG
jgi:hypothetical protein